MGTRLNTSQVRGAWTKEQFTQLRHDLDSKQDVLVPGGGIAVSGAGISASVDGSTIKINSSGQLECLVSGGSGGITYSAGAGIDITGSTIAAKTDGTTITTDSSGALTAIGGGGTDEYLVPELSYYTNVTGTELYCEGIADKDKVLVFKNGVMLRPDSDDSDSDINDYYIANDTIYFATALVSTDLITIYSFMEVSGKTYTAGTAVDLTGDAISVKTDNSTVTVNQSGQLQSVMSETSTLDQVLVPNTVYKLGTVSSVTASVGTASNKEIIIYFTADTGISVTLTGVTWLNGNTISPESGSSYVISILNNIAVWGTY